MSKTLSTNAAHYAILRIASELAEEKGDLVASSKYHEWANNLKSAINQAFWLENSGLYSAMKTTELDAAPVQMYDLLGESLAILEGIAEPTQAALIMANYPHSEAGPPVIWPQLPDTPIYHNRGMWPFVTAYALRAARVAKNDAVVDHNVMSLVRLAALNLSNMENYEFLTGQHTLLDGSNTGPVINSQRQLWSVAGYLSMVMDVIFGLESNQDGIRFQPFVTRNLRNTLFGDSDKLVLNHFPYKGKRLTVEIILPPLNKGQGGYLRIANTKLNEKNIHDSWITEDDLSDSDNRLVIRLAGDHPAPSSINVVRVVDPKNPAEDEVRAIWAPYEPGVSIQKHPEGGLKLTIDSNGERDVVFNIYRNGELHAARVTETEWIDWDVGISMAAGGVLHFTAGDTLSSNGPGPVDEHGHWHFANWGFPGDELVGDDFEAEVSGRHYIQVVYGNALNSINTGITAATKWVKVEETATGAIAGEGVITMPHRSNWADWGDSSLLAVSLTEGATYRVIISDFYNMSYFEHFAIYNGAGGMEGEGPTNRANVAEVKVIPAESMYCYSVESEFIDTGNRSHHSLPQCYTPAP